MIAHQDAQLAGDILRAAGAGNQVVGARQVILIQPCHLSLVGRFQVDELVVLENKGLGLFQKQTKNAALVISFCQV